MISYHSDRIIVNDWGDCMSDLIPLTKKCQFDADIHQKYRASACGPVTAYALLDFHMPGRFSNIDALYRQLGSTPIGLFTYRFIRNLRKLLGKDWLVAKCSVNEMKRQITLGQPVAAKFDKWFSCQWFGHFSFDYHWVAVVGYEDTEKGLLLYVDDHGGPNRPSVTRIVPYEPNRKIITFIQITNISPPTQW